MKTFDVKLNAKGDESTKLVVVVEADDWHSADAFASALARYLGLDEFASVVEREDG